MDNFAPDDFVLLAHLAFAGNSRSLVDELHAAGLAGSVLFVAMGTEASPLVVATDKDLLIIETHFGFMFQEPPKGIAGISRKSLRI